MPVSVCIITRNEEENLPRTLATVRWASEVIVVDSGSTDRTCEIARALGAKVFSEPWQGFARQKNSAIAKASGDWVLSLDADEEVSPELAAEIRRRVIEGDPAGVNGYWMARRNLFLGRWVRHGGFYPDRKLRLWRRGTGQFEERPVHETARVEGSTQQLAGDLVHRAYPSLAGYLEHMNRYSSLGAELAQSGAGVPSAAWVVGNAVLRPAFTFAYNYLFRLGFLDGVEGLLLHLYHAGYVSWKYAKAWELAKQRAHVESPNSNS